MTSDWPSPVAFRAILNRSVVVPPALLGILALVFLGQIMYMLSAVHWIDHTDRVISRASILLRLLVDGETGLRGYLLTGDTMFLEPYHIEEKQSNQAFEELIDLVSDNHDQVERLQSLRTDHADWRSYVRKLIDLRRQEGDYLAPVRNAEGKRRMDSMREQVAAFIRVEEGLREVRSRTAEWTTWVIVPLSLGLALLLGSVLAFVTRRQLLQVSGTYQMALSKVEAQAESLRKSVLRLESLHEIDRAILRAESVPELARSAMLRMEQIVPGRDAFIIVVGRDKEPAEVIARRDQRTALGVIDPPGTLANVATAELDDLQAIVSLTDVGGRSLAPDRLVRPGKQSCLAVPLQADGKRLGTLVLADPQPSVFTDEHQQIADEVARQLAVALQQARLREDLQRHADELERRVEERTRELQQALENVKQLQGLLPICAWCKKIRDDQNYWHGVEHYVAAHTEARFTHGICPDCLQKNLNLIQTGPSTA